jgi:hypothetical protein
MPHTPGSRSRPRPDATAPMIRYSKRPPVQVTFPGQRYIDYRSHTIADVLIFYGPSWLSLIG